MLPSSDELQGIQSVSSLLHLLGVDDDVWDAVVAQTGDPREDLRLVAALPRLVLVQASSQALLPNGNSLAAIQATQVGLVWRTARLITHINSGAAREDFQDEDPWEPPREHREMETKKTTKQLHPGVKEQVLKMSNLLDQADDSELLPPDGLKVHQWSQRYVMLMGASPEEEEEPTDSQLAALHRRVLELDQAPYCDFAVWQPYGRRALRAQKFRVFHPLGDGSFLTKELPGPQNLQQWTAAWRVSKVAALSLGIVSLAALQMYEKGIEKLTLQWPKVWGLIAMADDKGRAERLEKIRRGLLADQLNGKPTPDDWTASQPWSACFRLLASDEKFWNEQVRHPAAAWTASGSRGAPIAPADAIAQAHLPGGMASLDIQTEEVDDRKRQSNRDKRAAKKRRAQAEREEMQKWKAGRAAESTPKGYSKGKGKGKSKDQSNQEICYSWANGKGPCGDVGVGGDCKSKIKRVHKCQYCLSPAHRNKDCEAS